LLFDPALGIEAEAVITSIEGRRVTLSVDAPRVGNRVGVLGLHLVQGLGKGDKPEQVVRDGVVLGAQSISFVACERSVAQSTERDAAKHERLVRIATDAARQCGRSNIPTIQLGGSFEAAAANLDNRLMLLLHPGDDVPTLETVLNSQPNVAETVTWVGPEGGFSVTEVGRLTASGAHLASLGNLVLRMELAAVVSMARVGAWMSARG
jgi:16S rRNA (uracil1498-N3)-methyltransferase